MDIFLVNHILTFKGLLVFFDNQSHQLQLSLNFEKNTHFFMHINVASSLFISLSIESININPTMHKILEGLMSCEYSMSLQITVIR